MMPPFDAALRACRVLSQPDTRSHLVIEARALAQEGTCAREEAHRRVALDVVRAWAAGRLQRHIAAHRLRLLCERWRGVREARRQDHARQLALPG